MPLGWLSSCRSRRSLCRGVSVRRPRVGGVPSLTVFSATLGRVPSMTVFSATLGGVPSMTVFSATLGKVRVRAGWHADPGGSRAGVPRVVVLL